MIRIRLCIKISEKNDKTTSVDFCLESLVTQVWKQILIYFTGGFNYGSAEGINQIIKMLNRRGFGFRNFMSFRLYVLIYSFRFPVKNGRAKKLQI